MADVRSGMNVGGGGQAKKIQLVTDLREEYNKLNQVLQKTKELSADIAANMKAGKGGGAFAVAGGGGPGVPQMPGAGTLDGFVQPPNPNQQAAAEAAGGMSFGKFVKGLAYTVAGVGALAAQSLPTNQQAVERSVTEARLNFMGGSGRRDVQRMMNQGLGISPEDGNRAAMMGLSAGMIGANAQGAAAQFSNLAPGVGLQGGMNAAIGLNQAASVNRLRMVGINVRGADGNMREPNDIANDLWKQLTAAAGGKKITKDAIAFSLQPGHALGSYINQYFSATPELRMAIINALMQKAGGAELDPESLRNSGLITEYMDSEGRRASESNAMGAAVVDEQIKGIMEANNLLIKASETFRDHVDRFGNVITQISKAETLLGGGNNAVSSAVGTVGGLLATGGIIKMFKGIFGSKAGTAVKSGFGKKAAIAAAVAASIYGIVKLVTGNDDDTEESEDQGDGSRNVYGVGGDSGSTGNTVTPLSGSPRISSPFGQVRHLTFNGKKSPSYGQPHGGVDFAVSTGTPVMAANDGVVVGTPYDADGFGNYVQIQHRDGHSSYYGHLASKGVSEGQEVTAGQVVGVSGNSGNSTGPHLHFEVRRGGIKVDPLGYLSGAASVSPGEVGSQTSGSPVGIGIQGANLFEKKAGVNLFTPTSAGDGSSSGGTIYTNYGGVTVNINVPGGTKLDEKKLAREIKTILANEDAIRMAVSR
jgi:murein DD-endopeptidase MepM/ murein hydrolase activator NlpD